MIGTELYYCGKSQLLVPRALLLRKEPMYGTQNFITEQGANGWHSELYY
jgi:hypothetical protein